MNESYLNSLNWRYATKKFSDKKIQSELLAKIIEAGRLSPSSYGLEPWRIFHVTDIDTRQKIRQAGFNQPQITDASDLLVICARTDGENLVSELINRIVETREVPIESLSGFQDMMLGSVENHKASGTETAWHKSQTYLMLGFILQAAAIHDVDASPMEGFDPVKVAEILGTRAQNLVPATIVALGYRSDDDGYAKLAKVRRNTADFVTII